MQVGAPIGSCAIAVEDDEADLDPDFVQLSLEELLNSMPDVVNLYICQMW